MPTFETPIACLPSAGKIVVVAVDTSPAAWAVKVPPTTPVIV